jgi:Cu+-exporting ATPase
MNVFTSVLIIACPCAIALAAPFTFGNLLRQFGKKKFYLKNATVIEQLASIDTIIFDKTGTITSNKESSATYEGDVLSGTEELLLKNTLRGSNHPLSRSLYDLLEENEIITLDQFEEHLGQGIQGTHHSDSIKIGSAKFVGAAETSVLNTSVYVSSNNKYKGKFIFYNSYRKGLSKLFNQLKESYDLAVLSGDNEGELENLKKLLPSKTKMLFNQKPNVGIALSENVNVFSPACDAILDATQFGQLHNFIQASKSAMTIVKWSFLLSFLYNIIGLYFAVTGQLAPVIAAILMPLSSISVVIFTTATTNIISRKIR